LNVRIELRAASKTYDVSPPVVALRHVDLEVRAGEFVAIVGPSGSGKSTLLNLIATLDSASTGNVLIDGHDVSRLSEVDLARLRSDTFGFVFQAFHLMAHRSATANVELGLIYRGVPPQERRERALAALEQVGLAHRTETRARHLSGGESQRVAIARAMVGEAPVIVADEPTGNLDSSNSLAIVSVLRTLAEAGATVVLVTHDPAVAKQAHRRVRVRDGELTTVASQKPPSMSSTFVAERPGKPATLRFEALVHEAFAALASRRGRTAAVTMTVAVATGLLVATLGLAASAAGQVSSRFDVRRSHDVTLSLPTSRAANRVVLDLPADYAHRLSQVAGIRRLGVVQRFTPALSAAVPGSSPQLVSIAGTTAQALDATEAKVSWSSPEHKLGQRRVLVGSVVANELALGPLDLDPVVTLGGRVFAVAGILSDSRREPSLADAMIVDVADAVRLGSLESAKLYLVTAPGAAAQVARQAPLALDALAPDRFSVSALMDPQQLRAEVQSDLNTTLLILSVLAGIGAVMSVANALMLGVLERAGELGLRRAIGARPRHLFAQISFEATAVGLLGGVVGLAGGLSVVLGTTLARRWTPIFDLRIAPAAVLAGALVGILGGLAAAMRAARIQPADALRL
jgi:macrolide transport system ATP-binding/permease protein